ncbi:MAG: patatin-like phospholipase family protein [Acidobacteria bacterium]|nr:patatin-like phospholipase family protein [Acidobacteriota bacterium]
MNDLAINRKKVTLVLSGGGSRGAMEAGFYRALVEVGVKIDRVIGASVGAVNGAFIAAGASPERLWRLWEGISFGDLFTFNWPLLWPRRAESSFYTNKRFRHFLEEHLPVYRFEDLRIPLVIVSTDLQKGESMPITQGNLIEAVLASTAIPGLLPPVLYDGRQLVDGGLVDNLPIDLAMEEDADMILAMRCGCEKKIPGMIRGIPSILSRSFEIAFDARYRRQPLTCPGAASLVVLAPCVDIDVGFLDFTHSRELLELAYNHARSEPARVLAENGI